MKAVDNNDATVIHTIQQSKLQSGHDPSFFPNDQTNIIWKWHFSRVESCIH